MRTLFTAGVLFAAVTTSFAGEMAADKKVVVEEKTVVCTDDDKGQTFCKVTKDGPGQARVDVDVDVRQDGRRVEKKVVVIRRSVIDDADADKDGVVSKAEYLAQAEKNFVALDKDKSGSLSKEEAMPEMPPVLMLED
jgi:hypothetical protein